MQSQRIALSIVLACICIVVGGMSYFLIVPRSPLPEVGPPSTPPHSRKLMPLVSSSPKRAIPPPIQPALQSYTQALPNIRWVRRVFDKTPVFARKRPTWKEQSPAWRAQMKLVGARLRKADVGLVFLVHGTFVGKDPFGVVHLLSRVIPLWKPKYSEQLTQWLKSSHNTLLKDKGNWLPAHVALLQAAMGDKVVVRTLNWSSRNDHLARVTGTLHLIKQLALEIKRRKLQRKRILLMGHSHAGQLFALLTHLLHHSPIAKPLLAIAAPNDTREYLEDLKRLRQYPLDIVTMGTPPRYTWMNPPDTNNPQRPRIRILHMINHRGQSHLAGSGFGALLTNSGDYVQQWGIVGSDLLSVIPSIYKRNRQLAAYLGPGASPLVWYKAAKQRMRLHHYGDTILVDYRDRSALIPNFASTVLGHAVYTELRVLLFNMKLIAEHWY